MIVGDTSVLSNLYQIGLIEILNHLFGTITITPAVQRELYAIPSQRSMLDSLPWVKVDTPSDQVLVSRLLEELDLGEAESIALALEHKATYLLIDEYAGRQIADTYSLRIIGIVGILIQAKQKGLIQSVKPYIEQLRQNGFRLNKTFVASILNRLGEAP